MTGESWEDFRARTCRLRETRHHDIRNSRGVEDAIRHFQGNGWPGGRKHVSVRDFRRIIRGINNILGEALLDGHDIILPHKMGTLRLRKYGNRAYVTKRDGKVKVTRGIDWDATLRLWHEDEEAHKDKVLVRTESREIFGIFHDKSGARLKNKRFFKWHTNRSLKRELARRIKDGEVIAARDTTFSYR